MSMIALDAAREILAEAVAPLKPAAVPLPAALGLRAVDPLRADIDLPQGDVSAMDGYAARWEDLSAGEPLPCLLEICPGTSPPPLSPLTVARIFTGAALPAGADTVIPQESATVLEDGRVRLEKEAKGSYVRRRGEIVRRGEALVPQGAVLVPGSIALLAAFGHEEVRAIPRPRIAVVLTGGELLAPGAPPAAGSIHDSNGPMLAALAAQARFPLAATLRADDELDATRSVLEAAACQADLVVTSGGVSVGDHDFVPLAIRKMGGEVLFHRVAIRPGGPVLAARLGTSYLVGLPGNPLSALVCWRLFAGPLGRALSGDLQALREQPAVGTARARLRNETDRTLLIPAAADFGASPPGIIPLPWKGSHDLVSAARADALVRIEANSECPEGGTASFYPLP